MNHRDWTPTVKLGELQGNTIYIKREDLLPFSFGGNKVRKAILFFQEIENGNYDTVITYGSSSSNHCRVIANMAAARNLHCHIISTEASNASVNRKMVELFGSEITVCDAKDVARTIEQIIADYKMKGKHVYFIQGGGHGNIGTRAYDLVFNEIVDYEREQNIKFDYIFLASGTGTTQAGLICGKKRLNSLAKVVGISIARQNPRGGQIVADSVKLYCGKDPKGDLLFIDDYICGGYGQHNQDVDRMIRDMLIQYGIPLDPTYTGKAFWGMKQYIQRHQIEGGNILFIHTGGTPIFCDWVKEKI